jgi:hypothetical protein
MHPISSRRLCPIELRGHITKIERPKMLTHLGALFSWDDFNVLRSGGYLRRQFCLWWCEPRPSFRWWSGLGVPGRE